MSELRSRMIRDMRLAGLVEGTRREYLRAVRQLTAYYMVAPDRLSERNVDCRVACKGLTRPAAQSPVAAFMMCSSHHAGALSVMFGMFE